MSQSGVLKTKFDWVKGHQDDGGNTNLSHSANMNIVADNLAGIYNEEYGQVIGKSPILPSCPVQLCIWGITISGKYKKHIAHTFTEPRYIKYVMKQFGWDAEAVELISWKCFKLAKTRIGRTTLLTKISNDLLPTAARLTKMRLQTASKCCLCEEVETFDHIL